MAGPGSQKNKSHKAGRKAGRSAREKHRDKRNLVQRQSIKAKGTQSKADRLNALKQQREKKRADLLQAKRLSAFMPPKVVALLPLSDGVDVRGFWQGMLDAVKNSNPNSSEKSEQMMDDKMDQSLRPVTLHASGQKRTKLTFLPPPADRTDPLQIVDIGRCADIIIAILPANESWEVIDQFGRQSIELLRSLGIPSLVGAIQTPYIGQNGLKERAASKKKASEGLSEMLPPDHFKIFNADSDIDLKQILRYIVDSTTTIPVWRQQRPQLLPDTAEFRPSPQGEAHGTLLLTGYVRSRPLSVIQPVHIPGAGDFQIERIEAVSQPIYVNETKTTSRSRDDSSMDTDGVVAESTVEEREPLVRENEVDPLDAEQTWPTEEELAEAERNAQEKKRRLPKGTSDYQAAWIVDDDFSDESEDDDSEYMEDVAQGASDGEDGPDVKWMHDDTGTDMDVAEFHKLGLDDDAQVARAREEDAARRAREADDVLYPDEFELPHDIPARRRLEKYRGLKSFRTSPWDPKEDLPMDYARVFAFENFKRAHRRAIEIASKVNKDGGSKGADVGTYVCVHVCHVPTATALAAVERIRASAQGLRPPVSVWGLLNHETKLSVLNFSVKKVSGMEEPIANKTELLFVTGIRTFPTKPIFSTDEHGADKHKMERFLHEGRSAMATVYSPIMYPPTPLLAFKASAATVSGLTLAATGSLKSCNPDRVVVKKIVLTGFPVKAHKAKAVVRSMFFTAEDVRWFSPVELWTKYGRRGRIREPLGTHGAMKCIFDGPISQQDTVCLSLYKRVYPKWPATLDFA